jgi:hypothetical protein
MGITNMQTNSKLLHPASEPDPFFDFFELSFIELTIALPILFEKLLIVIPRLGIIPSHLTVNAVKKSIHRVKS